MIAIASTSSQYIQPGLIATNGLHSSTSPSSRAKLIAAGDLVIIFTSRDKAPLPITITPGHEFGNAYGTFPHDDIVGLPFGAKIASRNRRGFVHLLRPNPELWTLALPHRTQIVYTPDMSFIAAHLGLSPGAKVIEAGTGSGSFSHYLTRIVARNHDQSSGPGWKGKKTEAKMQSQRNGRGRAVRDSTDGEKTAEGSEDEQIEKNPINQEEAEILNLLGQTPDQTCPANEGRVWSFEFHAGRAVKAWKEFEDHGLFKTLSLRHRNVCKFGFGLSNAADAVFLDLPAPWEALPHAAIALRSDVACRICCFSPCVEQVLRTVEAMRRGGDAEEGEAARWVDIETYECLTRTHMGVWVGSGGQTTNAPIDEAILRIRQVEEKKVRRREAQIERVKRERLAKAEAEAMHDAELQAESVNSPSIAGAPAAESVAHIGEKRKRDEVEDPVAGTSSGKVKVESKDTMTLPVSKTKDGRTMHLANVYARTFPEMKGHTSYLTFATLLPRTVKQEVSEAKSNHIKQEEELLPTEADDLNAAST